MFIPLLPFPTGPTGKDRELEEIDERGDQNARETMAVWILVTNGN